MGSQQMHSSKPEHAHQCAHSKQQNNIAAADGLLASDEHEASSPSAKGFLPCCLVYCMPAYMIAEEVKASNQQECTLTGKLTLLVSFSLELPEYLKRLMCSSSTFGRR